MTETEETNSFATLIKWSDSVDFERIARWLNTLQEQGHIEYHNSSSFDPDHGSPVLYFP